MAVVTLVRSFVRRSAVLIVLALALGWAVAGAADGGPQFSLRPTQADPNIPATKSYFIFNAAPGKDVRNAVLVRNSGTTTGTAHLYAVDGKTGQTSGAVYPSEGSSPHDVGAWIHLDRSTITLKPGEQQAVAFTVTIPPSADVGQHLGGIVAEDSDVRRPDHKQGLQINVVLRAVIAVQVNLPGTPVYNVTVGDITASGSSNHQTLVIHMRNAGNQMVKPKGRLTVVDSEGHEVQSLPLTLDTFVPQTAIEYPVFVRGQALGAGKYRATVELSYGTSDHLTTTVPFTITKSQVSQVFGSQPPVAPPASLSDRQRSAETTGWWSQWWPVVAGGVGAVVIIGLAAGGIWYRRRGSRPGTL